MGFWDGFKARRQQKEQERAEKARQQAEKQAEDWKRKVLEFYLEGEEHEKKQRANEQFKYPTNYRDAMESFRQAAELGYPDAQLKYAFYCGRFAYHCVCRNLEYKPDVAFKTLKTLCDTDAQFENYHRKVELWYQMGVCYREGIGTEKDPAMARSCWKTAAEQDSAAAALQAGISADAIADNMEILWVMTLENTECSKEELLRAIAAEVLHRNKATEAYQLSARMGNPAALARFLQTWWSCRNVLYAWGANDDEKMRFLPRIQAALGKLWLFGQGVDSIEEVEKVKKLPGNIMSRLADDSKNYFEQAPEMIGSDLPDAEQAKVLYENALEGLAKGENPTITIEYNLEKAAFGGYAPAQYLLGYLIQQRRVFAMYPGKKKLFRVSYNPFVPLEWFKRAVDQGYIDQQKADSDLIQAAVQRNYGPCSQWVRETYGDLPEKIRALETEESGDLLTRQGLEAMRRGDVAAVQDRLERALAAGAGKAGYLLALYFLRTKCKELDAKQFDNVVTWLQKAADQGQPDACCMMGLLLEKRRPREAKVYFRTAGAKPDILTIPQDNFLAMKKMEELCRGNPECMEERGVWLEKLATKGERNCIYELQLLQTEYGEQKYQECSRKTTERLSAEDYKNRLRLAECALYAFGSALFWHKCFVMQPDCRDEETVALEQKMLQTQQTMLELRYQKELVEAGHQQIPSKENRPYCIPGEWPRYFNMGEIDNKEDLHLYCRLEDAAAALEEIERSIQYRKNRS